MAQLTLKQLNASCTTFAEQIATFEKFVSEIDSYKIIMENVENLKSRLQKLDTNFSKFEAGQTDLETISEDVEAKYKRRDDYESRVFKLIAQTRTITNTFKNPNQTEQVLSNVQSISKVSNQQTVKLPTIELPSFSSNLIEVTFLALIDRNEYLINIQKLCYLISSLKGEAYNIIQSLETTHLNYKIALRLVTERFSQHGKIVYNHVNSLINLRCLSLKQLINTVKQHYRSLDSLKIPVQQWDAI